MKKEKFTYNNFFKIESLSTDKENDLSFFIEGIAAKKEIENLNGHKFSGDNVFDLTTYLKNPILIVDHIEETSRVIGRVVNISEDNDVLRFRAKIRDIETVHSSYLKDAIQSIKDGYLTGVSIGGFINRSEIKNNVVSRIELHEISVVVSPADTSAHISHIENVTYCVNRLKRSLIKRFLSTKDDCYLKNFLKVKELFDEK